MTDSGHFHSILEMRTPVPSTRPLIRPANDRLSLRNPSNNNNNNRNNNRIEKIPIDESHSCIVCPIHVFPNVKKEEINIFLFCNSKHTHRVACCFVYGRLWSADVAVWGKTAKATRKFPQEKNRACGPSCCGFRCLVAVT